MKKLSWYNDRDKILEMMINAELKPHGKKMKDVLGKDKWFTKYTFKTEKDYSKWKDFCIDLMTKKVSPKQSQSVAEKEFQMLDLMYGLRCKFDKI